MFEGYVTHERVEAFWLDYDRHQQEAEQLVQEVRLRKLSLLMSDYGIEDQNDTLQLAMILLAITYPASGSCLNAKRPKAEKKSGTRRN
jgi:hypothetical protein